MQLKKIVDPVCMNKFNLNCTEWKIFVFISLAALPSILWFIIIYVSTFMVVTDFFQQSDVFTVREKGDFNEIMQDILICNDVELNQH